MVLDYGGHQNGNIDHAEWVFNGDSIDWMLILLGCS